MTLGTHKISTLVSNWHVSDEPSLSDHRYVCFQIGDITINQVTFRYPKRTKWKSYENNLKVNLVPISLSTHNDKGHRFVCRPVATGYYLILLSYLSSEDHLPTKECTSVE
jgi:hypothetical protein